MVKARAGVHAGSQRASLLRWFACTCSGAEPDEKCSLERQGAYANNASPIGRFWLAEAYKIMVQGCKGKVRVNVTTEPMLSSGSDPNSQAICQKK